MAVGLSTGERYESNIDHLVEKLGPTASKSEDMADQFNTKLTAEEQTTYDQKFSKSDSYDYDMQGWHKANPNVDMAEGQHFPDTFKKPNHPTFSNESMYHGGEYEGGQWSKNSDDTFSFTPGKTNLEMHGKTNLKDYFDKIEPGNTLNVPFKMAMNDNIPKTTVSGKPLIHQVAPDMGFNPGAGPFSTVIGSPPPGTRVRSANENTPLPTPTKGESAKAYFNRLQEGSPTAVQNALTKNDLASKEGAVLGKFKGEYENIGNKKPGESADAYFARVRESPEYKKLIEERGQPVGKWDPEVAYKSLGTDKETYAKIVADRKLAVEEGIKRGELNKEGQVITSKYEDAVLDQSWKRFVKEQETRDSHSSPYSKLDRDQQEHWRKYVTDPEIRKTLGIPEGEGATVLPFKPK